MPELIPKLHGKPGRQRTVTAKAWISRVKSGGVFYSKVSLGDGMVHVLSTKTSRRGKALEFNLCHLRQRLVPVIPVPDASLSQPDMWPDEPVSNGNDPASLSPSCPADGSSWQAVSPQTNDCHAMES